MSQIIIMDTTQLVGGISYTKIIFYLFLAYVFYKFSKYIFDKAWGNWFGVNEE